MLCFAGSSLILNWNRKVRGVILMVYHPSIITVYFKFSIVVMVSVAQVNVLLVIFRWRIELIQIKDSTQITSPCFDGTICVNLSVFFCMSHAELDEHTSWSVLDTYIEASWNAHYYWCLVLCSGTLRVPQVICFWETWEGISTCDTFLFYPCTFILVLSLYNFIHQVNLFFSPAADKKQASVLNYLTLLLTAFKLSQSSCTSVYKVGGV